MMFRIGHGFDCHRLVSGRELWLGGVLIPHDKGLSGHSDADVLIHSICDALFGALAEGDTGKHFPDSDEQYRDIDSKLLLRNVAGMMKARGWRLVNLDATLVAEAPKISPYTGAMRQTLAAILETDMAAVSVKATTTEGLGPEGRGEGISAHAVVLIAKG